MYYNSIDNMASAAPVVPVKNEEEKHQKKGLHVLGYVVPWWVVIVVVALLVYLAYTQGYLEKVVGKPKQVSLVSPVTQSGGFGVETPENIRQLFSNRY
jgi:hypothetical protein